MRVLIVGCGYVGSAVGAQLVGNGHEVWGLSRYDRGDGEVRALGIIPVRADITVPESLPSLSVRFDWVVHCVSTRGGQAVDYERLYLRGTGHVLSWLSVLPPKNVVYTSSTSVYGQTDGSLVDETSPTVPSSDTGRILLGTEALVLEMAVRTGFAAAVLRVAGIYGPGRTSWLNHLQTGTGTMQDEDGRIINMIHRDDVAGAVVTALASGTPARIYNVVDDEPVKQSILVAWLAARLGNPLPRFQPVTQKVRKQGFANKRVSNRRLKEELGYQLRFPTFREGYGAIVTAGV